MSLAYDEYLAEHISNVNKGLNWMLDNLGLSQEEKSALETAMVSFNHDESKYSTEEYNAYDQYFYGGNRSFKVVQDFNYAWLHHIHQNPHHWQYWVLLEDDPEDRERYAMNFQPGTGEYIMAIQHFPIKTLMIPLPYIFEMIADWWSFSWKNGNLFEIFNWYAEHRDKQYIHSESRKIVERVLKKIWDVLIMQEAVAGHDISEIEGQYRRFWIEQKMDQLHLEHSSAQVIGKVVDTRETENGLEVTVEHSDDHLEHHGIIGQKWGVRNGPPYPLGYKEHRKIKLKELTKYGSMIFRDQESYDKMMEDGMPCSANPKSFIKEKGTIVYRVTRHKNDNKHARDRVYVSDDPDDYIDQPGVAYVNNYIAKYSIKKDLIVAGKDDIWSIYHNVTGNDLSNEKTLDFMANEKTTEIAKRFKEKAIEQGFDAMIDPMDTLINPHNQDQGYAVSMSAMIVFNPDDLKFKGSVSEDKYYSSNKLFHSDTEDTDEDLYGIPELKKFPMPDKKHVKSAIRFFNYVDPKYEKELAEAIIEKAKEFELDLEGDISVGDENRLKKYLPEKKEES